MSDDRLARSARLLEQSSAFRDRAHAAAGVASSATGSDVTGSVTVTLDGEGRVSAVRIRAGWRDRVEAGVLGDAVREAVQAAAVNRLAAWGQAFSDEVPAASPASAERLDRDGLADQLHQLSSGRMSAEDGRAALLELLAMAEDLERGIDEVSAGLASVESATHTGRSADRHVTVTLTGSGEVSALRYDRA
jgi:DNA-binding protein YbaB